MKRLFFLLFVITFLSVSCVDKNQKTTEKRVIATTSMIADIARNIAQELLIVEQILPVGTDPHIYEPTPRDAQLVARAQVLLMNGLTLEGWLGKLIENAGGKAAVTVCSDGVTPIGSEIHKNSFDPHAWMTAENGITYAKNIANSFAKFDPGNAAIYQKNCDVYVEKLRLLDDYIKKRVTEIPESQRILITSHDAFQYFGRAYGLRLESILGTSTEADAQTSDVQRVTNLIKIQKIKALFVESTVNPKLLEQISSDNQVKIGGKLFSDSLGDSTSGADTYLHFLKKNADVIVDGLK